MSDQLSPAPEHITFGRYTANKTGEQVLDGFTVLSYGVFFPDNVWFVSLRSARSQRGYEALGIGLFPMTWSIAAITPSTSGRPWSGPTVLDLTSGKPIPTTDYTHYTHGLNNVPFDDVEDVLTRIEEL